MKDCQDYIIPNGKDLWITNTGDWRSIIPILNQDRCTNCGICALYCPVSAIQSLDKHIKIDLQYCKGCGICAYECPVDAIKMIKESRDRENGRS